MSAIRSIWLPELYNRSLWQAELGSAWSAGFSNSDHLHSAGSKRLELQPLLLQDGEFQV